MAPLRRCSRYNSDAPLPIVYRFCDNEHESDTCAALVVAGIRTATAPSLGSFHAASTTPPRIGDLAIVTDWKGRAQCVIRTTAVEIAPFHAVTSEHTYCEGEGDRSLQSWRDTHWAYYRRELAGTGYEVTADNFCEFGGFCG